MPLRVAWLLRSDLGTLTGAEIDGRPLTLKGDSLLSGYYLNELLLFFLHRHDPQPEVFSAYRQTIANMAATDEPAALLRRFEIELLSLLGYGLALGHDALTGDELDPEMHYEYRPEQGPVQVQRDTGNMIFAGAALIGIREQRFEDRAVLRAANRLLRAILAFHLGGKELKSRKVLLDLHRGQAKIESPVRINNEDEI